MKNSDCVFKGLIENGRIPFTSLVMYPNVALFIDAKKAVQLYEVLSNAQNILARTILISCGKCSSDQRGLSFCRLWSFLLGYMK